LGRLVVGRLIAGGAAPAAAVDALYELPVLELGLGHAADA